MAQLCFQMIMFNADAFLEPVLESIIPFAPVIVTEGPVAYWQQRGYTTSTDRTNEILHSLVPENMIIHGAFQEKDEMMNAAIHLIPQGTTHVFMVDADEVWLPGTIENIISYLDDTINSPMYGFDSVAFTPLTFFGGFNHILTGFEQRFEWVRIQRWYEGAMWNTHRPPTVLTRDGKPMRAQHHYTSSENFYHYSYVMPQSVKSKIEYYASRNRKGTIPDYFEKVWLRWVLGNADAKRNIENEYDGVHEWLPSRRGDCRTTPFTGKHPDVIAKRLPELRRRFSEELAEIVGVRA